MIIEQAIYRGTNSPVLQARSPGFAEAWLPQAGALCCGFGERPAGVSCPLAIFARPFGRRQGAVVRAADQADGSLAFHLLVLPSKLYADLGGDPFLICEKIPGAFSGSSELSSVEWTTGPPPPRSVDQVRRI